MGFRTSYWLDFNFNKWQKDTPDCAVRSLVAGTGLDYELVCKKLGVKCIKGKGYTDNYGIDLDQVCEKFKDWLSEIEDNFDKFDDPVQALLNGQTLYDWLEESKQNRRFGTFLVYLDDNKVKDGGHIVCCSVDASKAYFVDTDNVKDMFVQCWCKVLKRIPKDSKYHWKYDKEKNCFL